MNLSPQEFTRYLHIFRIFLPGILSGYLNLLLNLFKPKNDLFIRIGFNDDISEQELELLSILITLSPGTIAFKGEEKDLFVHVLDFAKAALIEDVRRIGLFFQVYYDSNERRLCASKLEKKPQSLQTLC